MLHALKNLFNLGNDGQITEDDRVVLGNLGALIAIELKQNLEGIAQRTDLGLFDIPYLESNNDLTNYIETLIMAASVAYANANLQNDNSDATITLCAKAIKGGFVSSMESVNDLTLESSVDASYRVVDAMATVGMDFNSNWMVRRPEAMAAHAVFYDVLKRL